MLTQGTGKVVLMEHQDAVLLPKLVRERFILLLHHHLPILPLTPQYQAQPSQCQQPNQPGPPALHGAKASAQGEGHR